MNTRQRRSRFHLAASAALAAVFALSSSSFAQERVFFGIATGGTGGTYYPLGGMLAQLISNKVTISGKKLSATAETAGASVANAQLLGRKDIESSLSAHLATINCKLDPHEQLDCLVVVTEPWSVDNGFITPTFKVKRNRIEEVYGPNYEKWVGARKKVIWQRGV